MGSGASTIASVTSTLNSQSQSQSFDCGGGGGIFDFDLDTYKRLEETYLVESSRLLQSNSDRDSPENIRCVLMALRRTYDECRNGNSKPLSSVVPVPDGCSGSIEQHDAINQAIPKNDNPEDRLERNKEFLIACGAFHKGKARANIAKAQSLYFEGIDLDYVDADGCSAMHHACGEGHTKIVEWLLELEETNGRIINCQANDKCTPLWTAAFNGCRDTVMLMLLFGADDSIKGQPDGEPLTSPALAARRNRQPGLADAIDLEASLRAADPERRLRQLEKRMDRDEFKESIRSRLVAKEVPV